jgi:hypothetical protein
MRERENVRMRGTYYMETKLTNESGEESISGKTRLFIPNKEIKRTLWTP